MRFLLLTAVLAFTACTVDELDVDETEQAVGGSCGLAVTVPCAATGAPAPLVQELSNTLGRIQFRVAHTANHNDFFNYRWGVIGQGFDHQDSNSTGVFTVDGPIEGAMYFFAAQDCTSVFLAPSRCGPWTQRFFIFVRPAGTQWGDADQPTTWKGFFSGGFEVWGDNTTHQLGVCSAMFNGGQHVGKWMGWGCNIGWGGSEITVPGGMVITLVDRSIHWTWTLGGELPAGALAGGYENGRQQYICRAWHENGYHPGKWLGFGCNIGWGGAEIVETGWYQVLTRE